MAKLIPMPTLGGTSAPPTAQAPTPTPPKTDVMADPLLMCMTMAAKLLGRPVHYQVMRAGFALDNRGRVPLAAYPDMAHKNGLMAAWSRVRLSEIPHYVLPVLMPLIDGRACVLRNIQDNDAIVLWADKGMEDQRIPLAELQALARPEVLALKLPAARHDQTLTPMQGSAFNWFWGTLWRFRAFYVESMVATVVANILTLASIC